MMREALLRLRVAFTSAVAAAAIWTVACSGTVKEESNDSAPGGRVAVADAGLANAGGSAGMSAATSGGPSFGGFPAPDQGMCDSLMSTAASKYEAGIRQADLSCTLDGDCVWAPLPNCGSGCAQNVVSKAALPAIQKAIDDASPVCATFYGDNCPTYLIGCSPTLGEPTCVDGKCGALAGTSWRSLTFDAWLEPCLVKAPCHETMTVTPDGQETIVDNSGKRTVVLESMALQQLDAVIASVRFRKELVNGFPCGGDEPGTSSQISWEFDVDATRSTQSEVSFCIDSSSPDNDIVTIWNIVRAAAGAPDAGP